MDILLEEKASKKNVHRLLILYTGCDKTRELKVKKIKSENQTIAYFIYMSRLPPTGYAIYLPDIKIINFYEKSGNRLKRFAMPDGFKEIEESSSNE